jgi:hypothetical protein
VNLWRVRTAINGGPGGAELSTMFFDASSGSAQDAADAVRAFWNDVKNYMHTSYVCTVEAAVYTIDSTTGLATGITGTSTTTVTGADNSDPLPPATQGLARWHTGVFIAGRELTGKTFLPGVTEFYSTTGVPSGAYITAINLAISNLQSSGPITFGIYSRTHHQFDQATSGSVWGQWAVLRSRRS